MSILVNGSPTLEFKPHKGLRQRDPLTSFLKMYLVEFKRKGELNFKRFFQFKTLKTVLVN